ncbi:MAG TPA: DNA polymerase III subunit epsilon [Burkholderiales bacterium]|jgi:DNA polymerase-3 subunit epsilon|nr:DNA polymerase III subunit epsilon [Burkholderiales bacterium]
MRTVVLDTETTGLNASLGDRIIELGCIEILNRRVTDNSFQRYVNPERKSEEGALKVHGITGEFLQDKPKFREIAAEFLDYIRGAELVIHNAAFDVEFLNLELARIGQPPIEEHCSGIVDSLKLARELHPGKRNSLDALCERYQVEHAHRTLHGALLDAALLAEVYLAMTRGQDSLAIDLEPARTASEGWTGQGERPTLIVIPASAEEIAEHARLMEAIEAENKAPSVWRRFEAAVELR